MQTKKQVVLAIKEDSFLIGHRYKEINFNQNPNLKLKKIIRGEKCLQKNLHNSFLQPNDILVFENYQETKIPLNCSANCHQCELRKNSLCIGKKTPKTISKTTKTTIKPKITTNNPNSNKKKFSLDFLEGNIIKVTGILLTIIVASQIVVSKSLSFVKNFKADVLHEENTHAAAAPTDPVVKNSAATTTQNVVPTNLTQSSSQKDEETFIMFQDPQTHEIISLPLSEFCQKSFNPEKLDANIADLCQNSFSGSKEADP